MFCKISLCIATVLSFVSVKAAPRPAEGVQFSYDGKEHPGPDEWHTLEGAQLCQEGKEQSPLDINEDMLKSRVIFLEETGLELDYPEIVDESMNVTIADKGHEIKVGDFPEEFKLIYDDKEYNLLQFHFHTPSEHKIDGKESAMEVHFVHVNAEKELLVIGILFEEGEEESDILDNILSHADKLHDKLFDFNPSEFITDALSEGAFNYLGSLTTPPCSEGVTWFVAKKTESVTAEFLEKLHEFMPEDNARPVQNGKTGKNDDSDSDSDDDDKFGFD